MQKERIAIIIAFVAILVSALFIFHIIPLDFRSKQAVTATTSSPSAQKLQVKDTKIGSGPAVKSGDTIVIHYKGTLTDGTKFDSSYDRGQPFETQIGTGQVIKGWDMGVIGMKVGGKRHLVIPPSLGYGDQAVGSIPPNSTLLFDVELIEIKK